MSKPTSSAAKGGSADRVNVFTRDALPWGIDVAAAWSWRLLAVGAAIFLTYQGFAFFSEVTVPIALALLLSALLHPAAKGLARFRIPHSLASVIVVLGLIGVVVLMLVVVGQQVAGQISDLSDKIVTGLDRVQVWLRTGPLHVSATQLDAYIERAQVFIKDKATSAEALGTATQFGGAFGKIAAGTAITLFSTYFFVADGQRIWAYLVRFAPRAAHARLDVLGDVAWGALNKFVRATLLVAAADALGIAVWAKALGLPLVMAIAVLVFLGAFIPMVGATLAGSVAVLVALVDGGPWTALWMFVGVIVVQQVEGHVLQPFLMGRLISVHPLAVIFGLAIGIVLAGITGALLAVPSVAVLGAIIGHFRAQVPAPPDAPDAPDAPDTTDQVTAPTANPAPTPGERTA